MPDEGKPVNEPQAGSGTETQSQSGTPAGNEGSSGQGGGRTVENVYGELSRKYKSLDAKIDQMMELMRANRETPPPPPAPVQPQQVPSATQPFQEPVSRFGAPRQLGNFSDEQLNVALQSPTMTDYQKSVIRSELALRAEEQRFEQRFQQREQAQRVNSLK